MSRNEAQTRRDLIDPVLSKLGWTNDLIKVEVTPGGTDIIDGKPKRRQGRSDYLLCLPVLEGHPPLPIAILEAKKENSSATLGLQQAQTYAKRFNVPFAFSTNGKMYSEFGADKGTIIEFDQIANFPTPQALLERYESFKHIELKSAEARALLIRYKTGEATRFYYQDAAIRAVLENIAQGHKKVLLCLATGTGKTFIAKELLWKLAKAGHIRRALFLVDRDELRTQALTHLQGIFGDDAQEITTKNPNTNAKILIATYHTLNVSDEDKEPKFWKENFPKDFFSHIIIDECHRSAWGKWSIILTDNPDAVHIGLTATPRTLTNTKGEDADADAEVTANNIKYFGEPVYEYSIADGQNDGYLAACEVLKRKPDIDYRLLSKDEIKSKIISDAYSGGMVAEEEIDDIYSSNEFEKHLLLDDRIHSMCKDLFDLLIETGGVHQKSIIFCASEIHAEKVTIKLNNLYTDWCRINGTVPKEMYAFKCTAASTQPSSKELIAELRGSANSHFIATTVELLSTGVDVPNLNNVIFFKYIKSPISFYQMVGRGTRIGEPRGSKMMFRLYDYTNATRLFGTDFVSRPASPKTEGGEGGEPQPPKKIIRVAEQQFEVVVKDEGKSILCEEDGKDVLVPYEVYKERLATAVSEKVPDLETLRLTWVNPINRKELLNNLPGGENALRLVRELEEEQECDLYDVLAQLGFGYIPKTRSERAGGFSFRNKEWLKPLPTPTKNVLGAIAGLFAKGGIEELEINELFDEHEVKQNGGFEALINLPEQPGYYINQTKLRLLA
jgi:type I restriction enzyme R subunit